METLEMPLCGPHAREVTRHPESITWHVEGRAYHADEHMISDL